MATKRTRLRLLFTVTLLLFGHPHHDGWTVGAALLLAGAVLHAVGAGYLTKRRGLTTAGPYRFVRNPFYVADFLRDLGVLLACHGCWHAGYRWVWSLAAVYFVAMYVGLIRRRVRRREEPELKSRFGESYRSYIAQVPRFVPRWTPAPILSASRFAFANLRRNHEWPRLVAMIILIGLTYYRWEFSHHHFSLPLVLNDPWEASLFLALPLALVATVVQGRRPGCDSALSCALGSFVSRHQVVLASAPLAYALMSVRWEWEWDPGIWTLALLLTAGGAAIRTSAARGRYSFAQDGPHAWVRNPGPIGLVMMIAGAVVASELVWLLPAAVLWAMVVSTIAVKYEEQELLTRHGKAYADYASRVSRWVPRVPAGRVAAASTDWRVWMLRRQLGSLVVLLPFLIKELNLGRLWPTH